MKQNDFRQIIREILMEADFVPAYKKNDYYSTLSRGIRTGRGEKITDKASNEKGVDYFQKAEGAALNYLNSFKILCTKLKGQGLSDIEKELLKKSGESVNNTHISSIFSLMWNYAKNATKSNETALRNKIVDDKKGLFKSSFQNLPDKNNIKTEVSKCLMSYEGFLESINSRLVDDVRILINSIR